ncbi:hypothetical protein NA57DRAFT_74993 [Rhizodiscina lignyota]|uniref:Uncharacterized protein n=1 Tax=Rhizodiscina lignyota TaxID=1504668 RepID=A0A9P4M9L6_9PEZI|nr:hypothetical protein NA57DRAFT_74993 [Rhizodiscina lignyota]
MFGPSEKQLHWTQRVALVKHNLHAARQSGNFSFFKILQAHAFLSGTDYVATLTAALNDDADTVINTLDNLNAGIAYVFQDAFKSVYDSVKTLMMGSHDDLESVKAQLRVDVLQQIQRADFAIDRIVNSAIALIQLQPQEHQNEVACAWVLGATIITDSVSVCLHEINSAETYLDDFIRLENSWATVQSSVESSVIALRGILNLMAVDENTEEFKRRNSSSMSASSASNMFRRISTAFGAGMHLSNPPPPYRRSSQASTTMSSISSHSSPSALRTSFTAATPTKMPKTPRGSVGNISLNGNPTHKFNGFTSLAPIPATPGISDEFGDPFDMPSPYSSNNDKLSVDVKDYSVKPSQMQVA